MEAVTRRASFAGLFGSCAGFAAKKLDPKGEPWSGHAPMINVERGSSAAIMGVNLHSKMSHRELHTVVRVGAPE